MDPGLRDFGYFEGQNISIEWRLANGQMQLLPAMAEDLAKLNVDVLKSARQANVWKARAVFIGIAAEAIAGVAVAVAVLAELSRLTA